MSEARDTGGPAFPELGNVGYRSEWQLESGMTLRDYFAAKAMHALLAAHEPISIDPSLFEKEAALSYALADAMLKARQS